MIAYTIDRFVLAFWSAVISGCVMFWFSAGYSISLSGLIYRIQTEPFAACVAGGCFIAIALLGASAVKAAALT